MTRNALVAALLAPVFLSSPAPAHDLVGNATYLGNEGVLVVRGDTKILFDPLFDEGFGYYQLLPDEMRAALMAGEAPFDGIDVVFVSHGHDDHVSTGPLLAYLRALPDVKLVAPRQVLDALRHESGVEDDPVFARVTALDLTPGDAPAVLHFGDDPPDQVWGYDGIDVEVVAIPHAGGRRNAGVQNLVYRVTLGRNLTVMHLGDADDEAGPFKRQKDHWASRRTHLAFPPYWFYLTYEGKKILTDRINARDLVGVHVPRADRRGDEERRAGNWDDLFLVPGEQREIAPDD